MLEWYIGENGRREYWQSLGGKMDGLWLEAEHVYEKKGKDEEKDFNEKLIVRLRDEDESILGSAEGVITEKDGIRYMEVVSIFGGSLIEEQWEPWLDEEDRQKWMVPLETGEDTYFLSVWLAHRLGVEKVFGWNDRITDTKKEQIEEKVKSLVVEGRKKNFLETGRVMLRGGFELQIEADLHSETDWEFITRPFSMKLRTPDGEEAVLLGKIYHNQAESEVVNLSVSERGVVKPSSFKGEPNKYLHEVRVDVEDSLVYLASYYLKHKYEYLRIWADDGHHYGQFVVTEPKRVEDLVNYWLGF